MNRFLSTNVWTGLVVYGAILFVTIGSWLVYIYPRVIFEDLRLFYCSFLIILSSLLCAFCVELFFLLIASETRRRVIFYVTTLLLATGLSRLQKILSEQILLVVIDLGEFSQDASLEITRRAVLELCVYAFLGYVLIRFFSQEKVVAYRGIRIALYGGVISLFTLLCVAKFLFPVTM